MTGTFFLFKTLEMPGANRLVRHAETQHVEHPPVESLRSSFLFKFSLQGHQGRRVQVKKLLLSPWCISPDPLTKGSPVLKQRSVQWGRPSRPSARPAPRRKKPGEARQAARSGGVWPLGSGKDHIGPMCFF